MSATVTWKGDEWMQTVGIPAANEAVTHAAQVGAQIVRKSLGSNHGGTRSKPFNPPNTQSNQLRRSIQYATPEQIGKPLTAQVGTNTLYARVLEFGGTIRAKGKALVFPLNAAAEKCVNKGSTSGRPAAMRSVLNALKFKYTGNRRLVWLKSKSGFVICVMDKGGKGGKGSRVLLNEPRFLMTRQVTIKARPFLRPLVHNPDNTAQLARAVRVAFASAVAKRTGKGKVAA